MDDDFYRITADTYKIINNEYTKDELLSLSRDDRILLNDLNDRFKTAEDINSKFNLDLALEDKRFSNFDAIDYTYCLISGTAAAFSSQMIAKNLSDLHDGKMLKRDCSMAFELQKFLSHPGDLNDHVVGLGHRVKYGHDLFNLRELKECIIDKKEFLNSQANVPPFLSSGLVATGKILKHLLLADPLSKEGLPLPGHTLFRDTLHTFSKQHHELYQQMFTLKTRDAVGTALLVLLNKLYKKYRGIEKNSYKYYQINIASHSVCVGLGLYFGSLNYPSVLKVLIDAARASLLMRGIYREQVNCLDALQEELNGLLLMNENKELICV